MGAAAAVTGVVVSFLLRPSVYVQPAGDAIGQVAVEEAELLAAMGAELTEGWSGEQARAWEDRARDLDRPLPDGERLLVRARELLALHDQTLQELDDHHHRPLLVDLLAEGHTPVRVLHAARQRVPHVELVGRFHGGLGAALHLLLAGGLDVAFGRSEGLGRPFPSQQLCRRLVRLEPLALLLPQEDPLAALDAVPMEALRGTQVDVSAGNEQAPEWVDLGMRLLAAFGAKPSPPHPHAEGLEETVRHLHAEGLPILTLLERPVAPAVVVRPLTEPVPLYPWTMVFRRDLRHPGLEALQASADELARRERWLELPPKHWVPDQDAAAFGLAP
mgnify:CR=1 FL=1